MIHRSNKNTSHKNLSSGKMIAEIFMLIPTFYFSSCDAKNDNITRLCTEEKME